MVVLLEGSPIFTEELSKLSQSDNRVLGHLPDQGPSPPIAQFGQVASSRKSLLGSNLLPFKNDGSHSVLGDLQCCIHILVPRWSPDLCLDANLSLSSKYNSFNHMARF